MNLLQNEAEQSINHQVLSKFQFHNCLKCFSCIRNHPPGDFQAQFHNCLKYFSCIRNHHWPGDFQAQFHNDLKCCSFIRNRSSSAKKASNLATILILIGDNFTFVSPAFCSSSLGKLFLISHFNFWLFSPWAISTILS